MTADHALDAPLQHAAATWPERDAFRCRGEVLTYGALLEQARDLAACLADRGVRRGDRVGIYMTKGLEMPVAIYGVWMAGAAFVPLDTTAPPVRTTSLIEDCGLRVLVSAERSAPAAMNLANASGIAAIGTGLEQGGVLAVPDPAPGYIGMTNAPEDIAYIIFTSGSTGVPKGITHTHSSGRAFARAWAAHYGLSKDDVFFCTVPLHFDFSLADFLTPPMAGACTELVSEPLLAFPASLAEALETSRATIWSTVPHPVLAILDRGVAGGRDLSRLRWLIYGGEPLPAARLAAIRELFDAALSNSYGPAEVNQVTQYTVPVDHPADAAIPLGAVMEHAELALAEDGELLFAGEMVMQGYWNRPELTERCFALRDGRRYYRTGDLGAIDADGRLVFRGRRDRQVKLRGHRLELDEVEAVLSGHDAVSEACAVLAGPDGPLVGVVIPAMGHAPAAAELRAHCAGSLPIYAVPQTVIVRPSLPRTSTGKIDRTRLASELS